MNVFQIKRKVSVYAIEEIEKSERFSLRQDAKITFLAYLCGFFLSVNTGHSMEEWASQISSCLAAGIKVTKSGLQKRLGFRQLRSVRRFLKVLLLRQLEGHHVQSVKQGWFKPFGRVFIEDSVCVKLSKTLSHIYPGSHSKHGNSSTARIQLRLDLQTLRYHFFYLSSYRDNDQKFSAQILKVLRQGDLVLRDLGYWSLEVFQGILDRGAFLLSRYKPGVNLYDQDSGKELNLLATLKKVDRRGGNYWQGAVKVGAKAQVPLRLVALKCPAKVAAQRKEKARKDRNQKANHDQAYFKLLEWTIFLTHVPADVWQPNEMLLIYGFRWHIEMVFKVWKSKFGLQKALKETRIQKDLHLQIFLYLFLCYLLLCYLNYYRYYLFLIYDTAKRFLSMFKFAKYIQKNLLKIIEAEYTGQQQEIIEELHQKALHQKRKKRGYQLEALFKHRDIELMILIPTYHKVLVFKKKKPKAAPKKKR